MWPHHTYGKDSSRMTPKPFHRGHYLIVICLTTAIVGCGGEEYAPVSGIVTLNGEPLADAKLIFEPIGDETGVASGKPSYGRTDQSGHYTLKSPIGQQDGAAVGEHRVRIVTMKATKPTPEQMEAGRQKLERDERNAGVANPKITDEQVRQFLSDVIQTKHREMLPPKYNSQTDLTFTVGPDGSEQADFSLEAP